MIIPIFKERNIPIYEMEYYINEEPSDETKQFNKILESVKEFELMPNVEEMTAILEYKEKALDYCYKLAINTLDKRGFEKDVTEIYNAVNDSKIYSKALKNEITFAKYCTLQKVLGEIFVIGSIQQEVRKLIFKINNTDAEILKAITDLKTKE